MNVEISVDGKSIVKIELDAAQIGSLVQKFAMTPAVQTVPRSTPITKDQAVDLLSRIDARSAQFLRQIAQNDGTISWTEMRRIFGIEVEDDWAAFSAGPGKGITRALRHILQNKSARLVWWDDDAWDNEPWDSDALVVYVDGPALGALRQATGLN